MRGVSQAWKSWPPSSSVALVQVIGKGRGAASALAPARVKMTTATRVPELTAPTEPRPQSEGKAHVRSSKRSGPHPGPLSSATSTSSSAEGSWNRARNEFSAPPSWLGRGLGVPACSANPKARHSA